MDEGLERNNIERNVYREIVRTATKRGKLSKKRWFDVSANKNWLLSAIFTLGERHAGPRDAISSDTTKKNRIVDGWLAAIFLHPRPVFPETRDRVEHSSRFVWPISESITRDTKSFPSRKRIREMFAFAHHEWIERIYKNGDEYNVTKMEMMFEIL